MSFNLFQTFEFNFIRIPLNNTINTKAHLHYDMPKIILLWIHVTLMSCFHISGFLNTKYMDSQLLWVLEGFKYYLTDVRLWQNLSILFRNTSKLKEGIVVYPQPVWVYL